MVDEASRNPFHGPDGKSWTRPSVFAFVDILGYSQMIKDAESQGNPASFFDQLYEALSEARARLENKHLDLPKFGSKDFFVLKAFTDNIVIAWPIRDDAESELGQAIIKLSDFQLDMSLRGFFVRGAISIGNAFVDDIAVFGDALNSAHHGETALARDPRVILTEEAAAATRKHLKYYSEPKHSPQATYLLKDADGQWFLNYLETIMIAEYEAGPFYDLLEKHKQRVEQKLAEYAGNPPIFAKYAWVASYHNAFCKLYPQYFESEHLIDAELFRAGPTWIV